MYSPRLDKLRAKLVEKELDALWITDPANVRYLTGFGQEAKVLLTPDQTVLYTDRRYELQAKALGFAVYVGKDHFQNVKTQLRDGWRIGFEAENVSFAVYQQMSEFWPNPKPVSDLIETLRLIKEPSEIELIRQAAQVADSALGAVRSQIREGISEREIAINLEYEMRRLGADDRAFETIVASGPRGAFPHGQASKRLIENNEFVTIDYGAVIDGYHSDATRTFSIGNPSKEMMDIYDLVAHAQAVALSKLMPGVFVKEIDAAARKTIEDSGYGDAFCHPTGHGVGLFIHEKPLIDANSEMILQPGMVITIEPGIYISGVGGVRIEDLVLITENGFEVLSKFAK